MLARSIGPWIPATKWLLQGLPTSSATLWMSGTKGVSSFMIRLPVFNGRSMPRSPTIRLSTHHRDLQQLSASPLPKSRSAWAINVRKSIPLNQLMRTCSTVCSLNTHVVIYGPLTKMAACHPRRKTSCLPVCTQSPRLENIAKQRKSRWRPCFFKKAFLASGN
jgi:hypothetical protein